MDSGDRKAKIAIFGRGSIFNQYATQINFDNVVVIIDNDFYKRRTYLYGKYVTSPELLENYAFDYVVIFNQAHGKEIHKQLIDLGVADEKIVSWQYYLFFMERKCNCLSNNCIPHIRNIIENFQIKKIVDLNGGLVHNGFFCNRECDSDQTVIDLMQSEKSVYGSLYRKRIERLDSFYDAAVCLDLFINTRISEFSDWVNDNLSHFCFLILSIPYPYPKKFSEWADYDFSRLGKVTVHNCQTARLLIIETKAGDRISKNKNRNIKLITVTHKYCSLPQDPLYFPIFAGKTNDNPLGIQGDSIGDNISRLNPLINECTALYWAWKNTDFDFMGLCHYRRFFGNGSTIIDEGDIYGLLLHYDMIVVTPIYFFPYSVREQLKTTLQKDSFEKGYYLVRNIIEEKHPDYIKDFDEYFSGHIMYPCNMFITSRPLLNRYCSWLFSIIIPAAEQIDTSGYDSYSSRVIGFMAERLLTLWILHNGIKVKEVPVIQTEQ